MASRAATRRRSNRSYNDRVAPYWGETPRTVGEVVAFGVEGDVPRPIEHHPTRREQLLAVARKEVFYRRLATFQKHVDVACDRLVRQRVSVEHRHLVEPASEDACGEQAGYPGTDYDCLFSPLGRLLAVVPRDCCQGHRRRSLCEWIDTAQRYMLPHNNGSGHLRRRYDYVSRNAGAPLTRTRRGSTADFGRSRPRGVRSRGGHACRRRTSYPRCRGRADGLSCRRRARQRWSRPSVDCRG